MLASATLRFGARRPAARRVVRGYLSTEATTSCSGLLR
jgi:hypothetical protein